MKAFDAISFRHALEAEGMALPPGCHAVELLVPEEGVVDLKFCVWASITELSIIGRALSRLAKDHQRAVDTPSPPTVLPPTFPPSIQPLAVGERHCEICAPQELRLQGFRCADHLD